MLVGVIGAGVGVATNIKLNFVPQYLKFTQATLPTSFKVSVAGEGVIMDLDADAIAELSGIGRFGNATDEILLPLADGVIPNKVVDIDVTNGVAAAINLYGFSLQKGSAYVYSRRSTVLANSSQSFKKFLMLGFDSTLDDTSDIVIKFFDGTQQKFVSSELAALQSLEQNDVAQFTINNAELTISEVELTPSANITVLHVSLKEL